MSEPQRIQLSRKRGWRIGDAMKVDRTTPWGNPFTVAGLLAAGYAVTEAEARRMCVVQHDKWLAGDGAPEVWSGKRLFSRFFVLQNLELLRGRSLADWCLVPADGERDACHAASLMRRAAALALPAPEGEQ